MKINNINDLLEKTPIDPNVGVKINFTTGDETLAVMSIEVNPFRFLRAHYHKYGIETYQILSGSGKIKIGNMTNETLNWTDEAIVNEGDCFCVQPNEVHKLENISESPLKAIVCCKISHTNADDRFFVE